MSEEPYAKYHTATVHFVLLYLVGIASASHSPEPAQLIMVNGEDGNVGDPPERHAVEQD